MQNMERRFNPTQLRALSPSHVSSSPGTLVGYAAVFNSLSEDLGGFRERVAPGAFSKPLKNGADVRCLVNHSPDLIVGRTKSGTLRLSQDETGLRMECDLPDTTVGRDLFTSVTRGDLSEMSFAFQCEGEDWCDGTDPEDRTSRIRIRTLRSVNLMDTSIVTYPAYRDTSVSSIDPMVAAMARSHSVDQLFPVGIPAEVRSHLGDEHRPSVNSQERRRHLLNLIFGL